jgi:hypothetical protein
MVSVPVPFRIDNIENSDKLYYNSKDLQKYDPLFYWGCKSKPRSIIKKKQICESEYLFANLKMSKWNISSAKCRKSQLLITKNWVDKNMKSMNVNDNDEYISKRVNDDMPVSLPQIEKIQFLERIKNLEDEIQTLKMNSDIDIENERCKYQFLQLQLENNLKFSRLNEEKYLLQIQMLQNK